MLDVLGNKHIFALQQYEQKQCVFLIAQSQDSKVVVVWPVKKSPDLKKALCSLSAPFGSMVKSFSTFRQEVSVLCLQLSKN